MSKELDGGILDIVAARTNCVGMPDDYIDVEVVEGEEPRPQEREGQALARIQINGSRYVVLDGSKGILHWILSIAALGLGLALFIILLILFTTAFAIVGGLAFLALLLRPRALTRR